MENFLIIMNVIFINTLLSSDNAVALAALVLPLEPAQRRKAIRWGALALVIFLVAIAAAANSVMSIPGVKVVGAIFLYWIAVRLLIGRSREDQSVRKSFDFGRSVVTVVISIVAVDIVTSLDNVLAIISAAKGNMLDIGVGILVSIPMILWGSERIARFLERFPQLIRIGGVILGWVAGQTLTSDIWIQSWLANHQIRNFIGMEILLTLGCCGVAWLWGKMRELRIARHRSVPPSPNR